MSIYGNPVMLGGSGGGGGGDVQLLTREQWNSYTVAQKRSYGLIAIQDAYSGYQRGRLVYGEEYNPVTPAEMVPTHSWNASDNQTHSYNFSDVTLADFATSFCMAIMSQNGTNPAWNASANLLPAMASGSQGNGNWAICYGSKDAGDYASTYSSGDNWNNSEIVCFCFSEDALPVVKEVFYEQGQSGTYTFTYTPEETEQLLLVAMMGGSYSVSYSITGLTPQSHVTSSGGRFNDVLYGTLTSNDTLSISIPYVPGTANNGSLLVALLKVG